MIIRFTDSCNTIVKILCTINMLNTVSFLILFVRSFDDSFISCVRWMLISFWVRFFCATPMWWWTFEGKMYCYGSLDQCFLFDVLALFRSSDVSINGLLKSMFWDWSWKIFFLITKERKRILRSSKSKKITKCYRINKESYMTSKVDVPRIFIFVKIKDSDIVSEARISIQFMKKKNILIVPPSQKFQYGTIITHLWSSQPNLTRDYFLWPF